MADTFWSIDLWSTGFWADGFWSSQAPAPVVTPVQTSPAAGRVGPRKKEKEKPPQQPETVRGYGIVSIPGPNVRGNASIQPETVLAKSRISLPAVTITGKVRIAPPQGMQEVLLALGEYDLALALGDEP